MTATPFVTGTEIVYNDPASTTGPGRVLPIYIQGDAPAPVNLEFTGVSGTRDRILLANVSGDLDYLNGHSAQLAGAQL